MDEPTASLDFGNQVVVLAEVKRPRGRRAWPCCSPPTTPTMPSVSATASPCSTEGRLIAQGLPADVLTPERLRSVYGVSVVIERLSQGQTVCAPDYEYPLSTLAGRGLG